MPDESQDRARTGKIARMPVAIRNEVNRRLFENESGARIVAWINEQPEALRVLDQYFGEEPVTPQNLSEWRHGGYRRWLDRIEEVERIRDLSEYALKLGAAAGGNITDGSAAIAGGKIMAYLEAAEGEDLSDAIFALAELRKTDQNKEVLALRRKAMDQRDAVIDLARQKFRRQTCELFLKWYDDKRAKDIVESRSSNAEKLEQLGQTLFGEEWK
jgi:hypothetical protein